MRERLLYGAAALLVLLLCVTAFVSPAGAWPLAVVAIGCVAVANFDKFQEISAGSSGVRAVLRDAETRLFEVREAIEVMSELHMNILQREGRFAAEDDAYKDDYLQRLRGLMLKAGVGEEQIAAIKARAWDPFVLFDYVLAITGASLVPEVDDPTFLKRWKAARNHLALPSVEELTRLIDDAKDTDPDRRKLLLGYEYYKAHGTHLDPELWHRRGELNSMQRRLGAR